MKEILYTVALSSFILFSCSANQQLETENETTAAKEEIIIVDDSTEVFQEYLGEKLKPIREYVAEVDSISNGDWSLVMDKELELNSDEVVATIYVWNSVLKKIRVVNKDASTKGESSYYFKNNELVYVSEQSMQELGSDGLLLVKDKSFFEDETLIRSFNNQDCGAPFNQEYRDEEQKRIMSDLDTIRAAFEQN